MKNFTFILLMLIASVSFAQNSPINFEPDGHGADWTWNVFENDTNPALEIIDNPDASGINTSDKVAKFTALQSGQPYAGVESAHNSADLGPFVLDESNSIIKIMVWKSVISDVGIKLVANSGWAQPEIKVANTLVNQWEELTFNFSGVANPPEEEGQYDQIVVFPDFDTEGRDQDNVVYFDNITFSAPAGGEAPGVPAGFVASNIVGENPVNPGEVFLACGPNQVGGDVAYRLFYSKTADAPADPTTATEYTFGSTAGDGDGTNAFGFVLGGLEEATSYSFWLYQYNTAEDLFSASAAASTVISGGETQAEGPNAPIDFEANGFGADWTWSVFENDTNPALEIIDNPDTSGGNNSAKVAKFTALQSGQPWAGVESAHGETDLGPFVLDATNSIIKIMVWKPDTSDVGIKLVSANGWSQPELKVANTMVNQWEELTFDFSDYPNPPEGEGQYDQIVVFPDFNTDGRTQDNVIYFDNITFNPSEGTSNEPSTAAPTPPERAAEDVLSVFSDAYTDVAGTDFNPAWGQSTIVSTVDIEGSQTLKYANLNYQGTTFASALDVTVMDKLHVDMWTADATEVNFFCISTGPVETAYSLPVTPNQWVSYDIPLSAFAGVDLADIIQFKVTGNDGAPTIFLDNLYFYKDNIANAPATAAPTPPARDAENVISVFSNAYTNVEGTDFFPGWGQTTAGSTVEIEGNQTLKYAAFNYQGMQFASALDVTGMENLHVDMWTADASTVNVFLISTGPTEIVHSLNVTPNEWGSYDIPLTEFAGVDLADIIQFKFDGGDGSPTIYLDNLYFYKVPTSVSTLERNKFRVYPNPVSSGVPVQLGNVIPRVDVIGINGKLILSELNTSTVKTDELKRGVYFLRIQTNNGTFQTTKFIIK